MPYKFKAGDRVTHHARPGQVGKVMEVEEDRYSSCDPIFHVCWTPDKPGSWWIPMRSHPALKKVED